MRPYAITTLGLAEHGGVSLGVRLGIERLWSETLGDSSVCIAILDGPVDLAHPCFNGAAIAKVATQHSKCSERGPAARHGTHVASVILGQHGSSIEGIAPRCKGITIPIFRDGPKNSIAPCSQLDVARGITTAVEAGAHVINISGGQFEPSGEPSHFLARAIQLCAQQGVLIVAAAGNEGCECLHVPAAVPPVLAVGAMDSEGNPLPSSNWGAVYQTGGVLALGENILGALPGGGICAASGTSSATPIVSGVAALLVSLQRRLRQKPNAEIVRSAILTSAAAMTDRTCIDRPRLLAGRLDVEGARIRIHGVAMAELNESELDMRPPDQQTPVVDALGQNDKSPSVVTGITRNAAASPANAGATASTCGCGQPQCSCGGGGSARFVFAIGQLGFDYGTEARRDSIAQHMGGDPYNPELLLTYLEKNPWEAAAFNWTLSLDEVRIYAIYANTGFAEQVYQRLREFLVGQLKEGVERVSVAGVLNGNRALLTGEVVPVISPDLRGMYSWTTAALVAAVAGPIPGKPGKDRESYETTAKDVRNFLERVYHELRNLGVTAQERAINYAAANAFTVQRIFASALKDKMELDTIESERSPICRPDSDCWDVKLTFFDPERLLQRARKTYRFTVDVSDVVPVTIGPVRSWYVR